MTTLLIVLGAFLAGYLWGKAERFVLAFIFDREESPMRVVRRVFGHQTTVSTWAIVTSLVLSSLIGVAVVLQGHADSGRTSCSIEFNRLSALARDDRLAAQSSALQAQIEQVQQDLAYQNGLTRTLTDAHATLDKLLSVVGGKKASDVKLLKHLRHQQDVSAAHAYPPPNFCEGR